MQHTVVITDKTDADGLSEAYKQGHTAIINNTLYIAGTHYQRDVYDDIFNIPNVWKHVSETIPGMKGYTMFIHGLNKVNPSLANKLDLSTFLDNFGDLRNSERYIEAKKALKANPHIERVVGHSLGSMVGLELQKQYPGLKSRSYSSPVFDLLSTPDSNIERYRNAGDPISAFDRGAKNNILLEFV